MAFKKSKFFKNTMGHFAEVVIASTTDDPQANYELFVTAGGNEGAVWAFFEDSANDNPALAPGDLADAANADKLFFFGYKDADGIASRTTALKVKDVTKDSISYAAGTAQAIQVTGGGTYQSGQILHVKIIDTRPTQIPYPFWLYTQAIGSGGINAAITDIASKINAEKVEPIVTASPATNVLTVTGKEVDTTFKIVSELETTPAQPTDSSAITVAVSTPGVHSVGLKEDVTELYRYHILNKGAVEYTNGPTTGKEFGHPNIDLSATQWGYLLLREKFRTEEGVTRNYWAHNKVLIAVPQTELAALAAL